MYVAKRLVTDQGVTFPPGSVIPHFESLRENTKRVLIRQGYVVKVDDVKTDEVQVSDPVDPVEDKKGKSSKKKKR